MIETLEHIGLSVSDLTRSTEFYCKNFGFTVIRTIEGTGQLGKVVGIPDCKATIRHLGFKSIVLELFEYREPNGKLIPLDRIQADKGIVHLGFRSSDVREDYRKLKDAGVRFFSEPVEFRKNVWLCYCYGPDLEVCEIRESEKPLSEI